MTSYDSVSFNTKNFNETNEFNKQEPIPNELRPTYGMYFALVFIIIYHALDIHQFIMQRFGVIGRFVAMVIAIVQVVYGLEILSLMVEDGFS